MSKLDAVKQFSFLSTISLFALSATVLVSFICAYAYCSTSGSGISACKWAQQDQSFEELQRLTRS